MKKSSRPMTTPAIRRWTFPVDFPGDFHGEGLRNQTYESRKDPEVWLLLKGKGKEAGLVFMGHALMENRNGLALDFLVSTATGRAERDAVPGLLDDARERGFRPWMLGGDRGYNTRQCVKARRDRGVKPHVAQQTYSSLDGRTTGLPSYWVSQKIRKQIGEILRRMNTVGGDGLGIRMWSGPGRPGTLWLPSTACCGWRTCCRTGRLGPFSRCDLPGARCAHIA